MLNNLTYEQFMLLIMLSIVLTIVGAMIFLILKDARRRKQHADDVLYSQATLAERASNIHRQHRSDRRFVDRGGDWNSREDYRITHSANCPCTQCIRGRIHQVQPS